MKSLNIFVAWLMIKSCIYLRISLGTCHWLITNYITPPVPLSLAGRLKHTFINLSCDPSPTVALPEPFPRIQSSQKSMSLRMLLFSGSLLKGSCIWIDWDKGAAIKWRAVNNRLLLGLGLNVDKKYGSQNHSNGRMERLVMGKDLECSTTLIDCLLLAVIICWLTSSCLFGTRPSS